MAKALNPQNGFIVHGWMVTELKLKGPELATYAIVYQFSQSKAGIYKGGVPYIMSWLGCGKNSARRYLHSLEEKGFIRGIDGNTNGVPYRNYEVIDNQIPQNWEYIPQNLEGGYSKNGRGIPQILTPDNKRDNNIDNNTPPTPSEVAEYCRARGWADPEGFSRYYIDYQTEAGWRTKTGKRIENWKLNVIAWEKNHKADTYPKPQPRQPQLRQMTEEEYIKSLMK